MFSEVKEFFGIFLNALGFLVKLIFIVFLFAIPGLISLTLNHLFGLTAGTMIFVSLCSIMVMACLYWLYKIWTNPHLTRTQKWDRSFGKNYT
ncbi:hypothetical protein QMO40_06950 [Mannheimia bovis]|uniref:hypothetical protein n=1 Tax=Mannheimia TaxID=75984 RepID=UPI00159F4075|nr:MULTISPECIES: hypothetical protein [Mannheimia]QLB44794.1 hypothetical protein HV561_08610 [Mannheimia pernigra]WHP46366.1 hypothetical protein QMO40_06950 [Mannheimia bovis]